MKEAHKSPSLISLMEREMSQPLSFSLHGVEKCTERMKEVKVLDIYLHENYMYPGNDYTYNIKQLYNLYLHLL
jgi:hypothetical protein